MQFRPYPVMTAFVLASLVLLVWLGGWQWERYQDKIEKSATPVTVPRSLTLQVVESDGAYAQSLYALMDGEPVWRRYVPAVIEGGDNRVVLTPWDGIGGPNPVALRLQGLGAVTRESYVFARPSGKQGVFGPKNQPDKNVWYAFDGPAMLGKFGIVNSGDVMVAEPVEFPVHSGSDLSVTRIAHNPFATPDFADPLPPSRHLGYALTWWGLAAGLVIMYFSYHVSQGRLSFRGRV